MVTYTQKIVFTLDIIQEMLNFVICDNTSEKVQITICCADDLTTEPHLDGSLFLHQLSWYNCCGRHNKSLHPY